MIKIEMKQYVATVPEEPQRRVMYVLVREWPMYFDTVEMAYEYFEDILGAEMVTQTCWRQEVMDVKTAEWSGEKACYVTYEVSE